MKKTILFIRLFIVGLLLTGCHSSNEPNLNASYDSGFTDETIVAPANGITAYSSIEKAQEAVNFAFLSPTQIPTGYIQDEISVVTDNGNQIAEIDYRKDGSILTYRFSCTTDAIVSDRSTYEKEKEIIIGNISINCSCNADTIYVATWQIDGAYYCIMAPEGLETTTLEIMIRSLQ